MALKERRINYSIEVTPRRLSDFGYMSTSDRVTYGNGYLRQDRYFKDLLERANEIQAEIQRHVDNVASVTVNSDTIYVCEHCEYVFNSKPENAGCCDQAVSEWYVEEDVTATD